MSDRDVYVLVDVSNIWFNREHSGTFRSGDTGVRRFDCYGVDLHRGDCGCFSYLLF